MLKVKSKENLFKMRPFSWEIPIEEEILKFVRSMAQQMESIVNNKDKGLFGTGLFADNRLSEDAKYMADAYRTVERHIEKEIEIKKLTLKDCKGS